MKRTIESDRILMRMFDENDLDDYYNILANDKVYIWLGNQKKPSKDNVLQTIHSVNKLWKEKGYGFWAVVEKNTNKLIGHSGFNILNETNEIELLYAFHPKAWKKGYARESTKLALEYLKENLDINRLVALSYPENTSSINVIEKNKFKYMGMKSFFGSNLRYYELHIKNSY